MPTPAIGPTVRAILAADLNLPADEVIRLAKSRGVTAPDHMIRTNVHNIRSELKKRAAKAAAAPAAARKTQPPKPAAAAAPAAAAQAAAPAPASVPTPDLASVLANVEQVNTVVGVAGGIDQARQVAEAVRACGSVEAFLQHLELVAKVRTANAG